MKGGGDEPAASNVFSDSAFFSSYNVVPATSLSRSSRSRSLALVRNVI